MISAFALRNGYYGFIFYHRNFDILGYTSSCPTHRVLLKDGVGLMNNKEFLPLFTYNNL